MQTSSDDILSQLRQLRALFADAAPTEPKIINDYAWILSKALNREYIQLGSLLCRQLLADYLKLPTQQPSRLHSSILSAAIKISNAYPDFRFASFLNMWNIDNLRPEDYERQQAPTPEVSAPGSLLNAPRTLVPNLKTFPSLAERTAKTLGVSLLLHTEEASTLSLQQSSLLSSHGFSIHPMLVTRIKDAVGKDGRKYYFVTLTSPEGLEVETTTHSLVPSPLHPLPDGKRHYVNIGQLYDCLLHAKQESSLSSLSLSSSLSLKVAYLSQRKSSDYFSTSIGYIEALDTTHGHMHIFDQHSRHFVASIQRFSKETAGTFVRFIPIIPRASKFKSAIILATVPSDSSEVKNVLREIRITHINKEKGYAAWDLVDKNAQITELLSPLQVSQGEQSPFFTSGFLNLASVPDGFPSGLSVGQTLHAFIYLKRGKDRQKRPHIAQLFNNHLKPSEGL